MKQKKKKDQKWVEAGQWHGVTEGTAFRRGGYRSPLPCSTHPLPVGHRSSLGPPGPPNNWWFVAGNDCSGCQAQLDQHSPLPDWPGELLHWVTPGKPTGNMNKWRVLEKKKKKASQLTFHCGAHLMLSALTQTAQKTCTLGDQLSILTPAEKQQPQTEF